MKRFLIRQLDVKKDEEILNSIVKYEDEVFGEAAIGMWNIKPMAKYGKIYALLFDKNGKEDVVSVVEVLRSFDQLCRKKHIYTEFLQ